MYNICVQKKAEFVFDLRLLLSFAWLNQVNNLWPARFTYLVCRFSKYTTMMFAVCSESLFTLLGTHWEFIENAISLIWDVVVCKCGKPMADTVFRSIYLVRFTCGFNPTFQIDLNDNAFEGFGFLVQLFAFIKFQKINGFKMQENVAKNNVFLCV